MSLNICRKFEFLISQGSVATCLRWGGWCCIGFVANFIRFPEVQKIWKSVKIWQSYREFKGGNFSETQCRRKCKQIAFWVFKCTDFNSSMRLTAYSECIYVFLSKSCSCHSIPCWLLTNTAVTSAVTNFRCHTLIARVNK